MQGEKRKLMIQVAKLYYYGHMTQEEISKMLGISRSKVSRLLLEAEQKNIVRITISDPYFNRQDAADYIKEKFGLAHVIVVPSGNSLSASKTNIAEAATDFVNSIITDHSKIGISWGTTLNTFVNAYKPLRSYPKATVVQLVGGVYNSGLHMDASEVARTLAAKLQSRLSILQLPMFMRNPELKELILKEPETASHFKLFDELDIALVGIGSYNYKESVVYKANYITEDDARQIDRLGLCDICGHQIDSLGNEPIESLRNRLFGISLESLKRTPMVIGMCAGKDRAQSVRSGVNGGYLKALIIDEIAAITLMESEED